MTGDMTNANELPESESAAQNSVSFTPEVLDKSVIAVSHLRILEEKSEAENRARNGIEYVPDLIGVIVDLDLE
ncbi:MAG: hypothetical protein JWM42_1057 [Burkholderia sp.]|jgi:hypothetical protein|nr:hypothetical protein [Burkholderia sp.]